MNRQGSKLYLAEQVKEGERQVASALTISMYELMERAGSAVFNTLIERHPLKKNILVVCGGGNNGGDGYVVARLAKQAGYQVTLWQMGDAEQLTNDAAIARDHWLDSKGTISTPNGMVPEHVELIVDGLLGTGLTGAIRDNTAELINTINNSHLPLVSIDVPSGLHADTGSVSCCAVNACQTVTFIARKQGLYTGEAANYTGEIIFAGLEVSDEFDKSNQPVCTVISREMIVELLKVRKRTSHKGDFGKVLCMGGDRGMFGAIRLASEACARSGAGLTRVVTQLENVSAIVNGRPELMVYDWRGNSNEINDHLHWATVLMIGPGLGTSSWGRSLLGYSNSVDKLMVLDADGLNILTKTPDFNNRRIITPHPGEAARLLNVDIKEIEQNRFLAVQRLQRKYGGVVILKGAGSLVYDGKHHYLCSAGNPGMASGGMGDVLSGIIAGLLAQHFSLVQAACAGVWLHATAGDLCAAEQGERGMLASDLFPYLRRLVNA